MFLGYCILFSNIKCLLPLCWESLSLNIVCLLHITMPLDKLTCCFFYTNTGSIWKTMGFLSPFFHPSQGLAQFWWNKVPLLKTSWPSLGSFRMFSLKFVHLKLRLYSLLWNPSFSHLYIPGLCWESLKKMKRIEIRILKRYLCSHIHYLQ